MGQGIYYRVPSTEDGICHNPLNLTIIPGVRSFQMRKLRQDGSSSDEDPKQKRSGSPALSQNQYPRAPLGGCGHLLGPSLTHVPSAPGADQLGEGATSIPATRLSRSCLHAQKPSASH